MPRPTKSRPASKPGTGYYNRATADLVRLEAEAQRLREQPTENESRLAEIELEVKQIRGYVKIAREYGCEEAEPDFGKI